MSKEGKIRNEYRSLYIVGRDAHSWAKIKSDERMKTKNAEAAAYYLDNAMTLNKPSKFHSNIKNKFLHFELNESIRGQINATRGYIGGFISSMVSNVIPFALGLTALFAKNAKVAKGSAIALGAVGLYTVIKQGFGLGNAHDLNIPN